MQKWKTDQHFSFKCFALLRLTASEHLFRIWIDEQLQVLFPDRRRALVLFDSSTDSLPQNPLMWETHKMSITAPQILNTFFIPLYTLILLFLFSFPPHTLVPFFLFLSLIFRPPSLILVSSPGSLHTPFKLDAARVADTTPTKKAKDMIFYFLQKKKKSVTSWLWWGDVGLLVSHSEQNEQVLKFLCVCCCCPSFKPVRLIIWAMCYYFWKNKVWQSQTSSTTHYAIVWLALLPGKKSLLWKTKNCFSHFLSTSALFLLSLSSFCVYILTSFGLCSAKKTNKTPPPTKPHIIISFDEQSIPCQIIHLLQHRADMIQHNMVYLPLCNSLGFLCSSNFVSRHSEYQSPL